MLASSSLVAAGEVAFMTTATRVDRRWKACGRFVSPAHLQSRHGAARLRRDRFVGSPRLYAPSPRGESRSRDAEGDEARCRASSDDDEFLSGVWGEGPQRLVAAVLEDERDCLPQICETLFASFTLSVGSRHLRAIGNEPWAVLLDNRRKLVPHARILARWLRAWLWQHLLGGSIVLPVNAALQGWRSARIDGAAPLIPKPDTQRV